MQRSYTVPDYEFSKYFVTDKTIDALVTIKMPLVDPCVIRIINAKAMICHDISCVTYNIPYSPYEAVNYFFNRHIKEPARQTSHGHNPKMRAENKRRLALHYHTIEPFVSWTRLVIPSDQYFYTHGFLGRNKVTGAQIDDAVSKFIEYHKSN